MFCGGVSHTAKDCLKSSSSASKAKARTAQAKEKKTPDLKKRLSSPPVSALAEDCVEPPSANSEVVHLNASALSNLNSLRVSLTSSLVSNFVSNFVSVFSALIDSGSTHCFVDTEFVNFHDLPLISVSPIELKLFDGTSNSIITQSLDLPVLFSTGESVTISFYVTLLDSSCSVVLGFNWIICYNPLIDWVFKLVSITFCPQLLDLLYPTLTSSAQAAKLPLQTPSVSTETMEPTSSILQVSLISAVAFVRARKLPGAQSFRLHLSDTSVSANPASVSDEAPNLSHIPKVLGRLQTDQVRWDLFIDRGPRTSRRS